MIHKLKLFLILPLCLLAAGPVTAQVSLADRAAGADFSLVGASATAISYDGSEEQVVKKTAALFAEDIRRVTGRSLFVSEGLPRGYRQLLIVGTLENNALIRELVRKKKLDTTGLMSGWEQYRLQVVESPFPGVRKALVIAGSDRRGAAYGLLSLSELAGVSPWYWWADVPAKKRTALHLKITPFISKTPSVKYRGIFINDEDWGLKPWAAKTFEPELGDIGPRTYAKICELLLRLRANYLSPAMHSCTGAFNSYADNKRVADSFGIVMGSIHCEPLLFNNASEWDRKKHGEWNYLTNKDRINEVLQRRVEENGRYENVYTLAMRGIHDAVMAGNLTLEEQARTLEKAFADQRRILSATINKPAEQIPQVFYPYKEVLETYEHGLQLPEDVTIVWSDDDFGYVKRLSNSVEGKRTGGSGLYYHISYWGPPKHYLWVASTPPALMYEELSKTYRAGADRLWVVNVGDIKPAEYGLDLFMQMAWDIDRFSYDNINLHAVDYLCRIFGEQFRADLTDITATYYQEAFVRKPEYMERSTDTEFSLTDYREAERRLAAYTRIAARATAIMKQLPPEQVPAFFQLVYYPVKGSALVNEMTLGAQKNRYYARGGRAVANDLKKEVAAYGDTLERITREYNALLGGKWKGMMSLVHGGARAFERPWTDSVRVPSAPLLGIDPEGSGAEAQGHNQHLLPGFSRYTQKSYYVDIFNKGGGTLRWKAVPSAPWIRVDKASGQTASQERLTVSIDWLQVPTGAQVTGALKIEAGNEQQTVGVSVFNPATPSTADLKGLFVEENGCVSIDAAGFHRKEENDAIKFRVVEGLGFEGKVVQLGDPFAEAKHLDNLVLTSNYVAPVRSRMPVLEYDFYTFSAGPVDVYTYMLPLFPLNNEHGSRYGVMVDNSPVYLPEAGAPYYSTPWIQSVLKNCRINKTTHFINRPGKHTVKIFSAHPGMMLQKIVIDLGGMKRSYQGPPPTIVVEGTHH